jgi:cation transport regulator ChaB
VFIEQAAKASRGEYITTCRQEHNNQGGSGCREVTAHKVAWATVKKKYAKDEATGEWHEAS